LRTELPGTRRLPPPQLAQQEFTSFIALPVRAIPPGLPARCVTRIRGHIC